jgi:hypothetical protein
MNLKSKERWLIAKAIAYSGAAALSTMAGMATALGLFLDAGVRAAATGLLFTLAAVFGTLFGDTTDALDEVQRRQQDGWEE